MLSNHSVALPWEHMPWVCDAVLYSSDVLDSLNLKFVPQTGCMSAVQNSK
jgi:hypothetical protein